MADTGASRAIAGCLEANSKHLLKAYLIVKPDVLFHSDPGLSLNTAPVKD